MAHPIRPGALESIIHTYENVKNALDVAEATLKALNDELVPLENRRDALRQHHDEQSKLVDDLQGRLMAMFDPSSLSTGTSQGEVVPSQDQGDVLQQCDLKPSHSESPNDYEVYIPPPASKRLQMNSIVKKDSGNTSQPWYDSQRTSRLVRRAPPPPSFIPRTVRAIQCPVVNADFGNIVRFYGKVVAISCYVGDCFANSTSAPGPRYFNGIEGLHMHITRSHKEICPVGRDEVALRCRKTELDSNDVDRVSRGQHPSIPVDHVFSKGWVSATPRPDFV